LGRQQAEITGKSSDKVFAVYEKWWHLFKSIPNRIYDFAQVAQHYWDFVRLRQFPAAATDKPRTTNVVFFKSIESRYTSTALLYVCPVLESYTGPYKSHYGWDMSSKTTDAGDRWFR